MKKSPHIMGSPQEPAKRSAWGERRQELPRRLSGVVSTFVTSLPNERYRRLLVGLYREHLSMQFMAEEMEVSLPNLYNLHRRALASLKAHMSKAQA